MPDGVVYGFQMDSSSPMLVTLGVAYCSPLRGYATLDRDDATGLSGTLESFSAKPGGP